MERMDGYRLHTAVAIATTSSKKSVCKLQMRARTWESKEQWFICENRVKLVSPLFFLSLESNASLLHKANCVNINLGIDESSSCHNIDIMKEIELKNRTHFLDKNPEVSLPVNLDVGVNSELFPSLNSSSKGTDNPPFKDNNNSATKSWAKVLTDGLEASNNQMIGVVWNIRGLNKRGKLQCIADFIFYNKIDFVSFQETKKKKPLMIPFWGMSIGTLFGIASLQLVQ